MAQGFDQLDIVVPTDLPLLYKTMNSAAILLSGILAFLDADQEQLIASFLKLVVYRLNLHEISVLG